MKSIGERVRELREKILDKTQKEFGEPLGLSPNTIAGYEKVKIPMSGVRSICNYYHVCEEWLMNGTGEIFLPPEPVAEDALIGTLRAQYNLDDKSLKILKIYLSLPEPERKYLADQIHRFAAEVVAADEPAESKKKTPPQSPPENLRKSG